MNSSAFISAPISLVYTDADGEVLEEGKKEVFVRMRKADVVAWHGMDDIDETKVYLRTGAVFFINISEIEFTRRMSDEDLY